MIKCDELYVQVGEKWAGMFRLKERSKTRNNSIAADNFQISSDMDRVDDFSIICEIILR